MRCLISVIALASAVRNITAVKEDLQGVVIPVLTNYHSDADLTVDTDAIAKNVQYVRAHGVKRGTGFFLSGASGGDFPDLLPEERKLVAKTVLANAGDVPVIMCVQESHLQTVIELAQYADSIGTYGIQVSVPYYWTTTDDDAIRWFTKIHEATKNVKIFIYNVPWESYDMPLAVFNKLAEFERIVGIKWATYRDPIVFNTQDYLNQLSDKFAMVDNGGAYIETYLLGGTGYITHLATVWPEQQTNLHLMMKAGEYKKASDILMKTNHVWSAFRAKIAARTSGESSVVKAALDLTGRPGGPEREPTRDLNQEERNELRDVLISMGVPNVVPKALVL